MKTVTLFRHAKSDWKGDPRIADIERPLAARGLKAAPRMGRAMHEAGVRPDVILCSPAARARQTLELAKAEAWDKVPKTRFPERLYPGEKPALLQILKGLPEDIAHAMIVGHNPGLQDLAVALAKPGGPEQRELAEAFPTGSVASFAFEIAAWKDLAEGAGELRLFLAPKKLKAA